MKKINVLIALLFLSLFVNAQKEYWKPSIVTSPYKGKPFINYLFNNDPAAFIIKPDNPSFVQGSSVEIVGRWLIMGTNPSYQWYYNDVALTKDTFARMQAQQAGKYDLKATILFNGKLKRYMASINVTSTAPTTTGTTVTTIKNSMVNGMNYKLYEPATATYPTPKGILVIGSGNNENNPSIGDLNGGTENSLCKLAADNGYVAAVVAYTAGAGTRDWNGSATQMGNDFDACISDMATKYGVPKTKAVLAGVSYTSFMLLSNIAANNTLSYCKGLISSCGSTGAWQASNFKIPVYAINCAGNYEGDLNGKALYDAIPATSPIKALSDGLTDATCNGHCAGNWVNLMFNKLKFWVP